MRAYIGESFSVPLVVYIIKLASWDDQFKECEEIALDDRNYHKNGTSKGPKPPVSEHQCDKTNLDDLLLVAFTPFQSVQERPLGQGHDMFIHFFCSHCCSSPIVHIVHTDVRRMGIVMPCLDVFDSAGQGFEYFWKCAKR